MVSDSCCLDSEPPAWRRISIPVTLVYDRTKRHSLAYTENRRIRGIERLVVHRKHLRVGILQFVSGADHFGAIRCGLPDVLDDLLGGTTKWSTNAS